MEALIFNIQKFSLNDGPGIRTVVFLKGCPLRCAWCSNPESQSCGKQILWDFSKCARCGSCVRMCSNQAISFADQSLRFDRLKCTGCETCVSACPTGALESDSRLMTVQEVLEICRQDTPFYAVSYTHLPGRLMDHMHRQTVQLKNIRTVVLDEADRMLDMGFRKDMEKILRATPKDRQTVFFSATIPQEIYMIANQFLKKDAREIRVEQESLAVETVKQYYTIIPVGYKNDILITLLKNNDLPLTLIFVNMKHKADRLAAQLRKKGFKAAALHGDCLLYTSFPRQALP